MPLKGTLSGNYNAPVTLDNGNYANPVTVTGTVSLATAGIDLKAASTWAVTNTGSILGPSVANAVGVVLYAGGYVGNRGGVISSNVGVDILGGAGTVTNAGTIAGNGGVAVALAPGFANRIIVQPGAVFTGQVNGGNTPGASVASTLELAPAGTTQGNLYGFGSTWGFINFSDVTVDGGADWTLVNSLSPMTLAAGTTFTDSGTLGFFTSLTNAGSIEETLTNAGINLGFAFTNAAGGAVMAVGAAAGSALYAPSVYNAGLIVGQGNSTVQPAAAVASNEVTNVGTIGSDGIGIFTYGGGAVTNLAGGVINADGDAILNRTLAIYPLPPPPPETLNVFNAGLISNSGTVNNPTLYNPAIRAGVSTIITNAVSGTIASQYQGAYGITALYNAGIIETREMSFRGGSVSNAASGVIVSGGSVAVSATTVINAGTIAASGSNADAVKLAH